MVLPGTKVALLASVLTVLTSLAFLYNRQFADFAVLLFSRTDGQPRKPRNEVESEKIRVGYNIFSLRQISTSLLVVFQSICLSVVCLPNKRT